MGRSLKTPKMSEFLIDLRELRLELKEEIESIKPYKKNSEFS